MLRDDVVEAVKASRFAIYPIATIDQGIALLTGLPAGERNAQGEFPEGSVNRRVEESLIHFSKRIQALGSDTPADTAQEQAK
jgi:hypothetical protein